MATITKGKIKDILDIFKNNLKNGKGNFRYMEISGTVPDDIIDKIKEVGIEEGWTIDNSIKQSKDESVITGFNMYKIK